MLLVLIRIASSIDDKVYLDIEDIQRETSESLLSSS